MLMLTVVVILVIFRRVVAEADSGVAMPIIGVGVVDGLGTDDKGGIGIGYSSLVRQLVPV